MDYETIILYVRIEERSFQNILTYIIIIILHSRFYNTNYKLVY